MTEPRRYPMGTKVYFFNGNSYARYDRAEDRTDDGYPLVVSEEWHGLTDGGYDAALNLEVGKVYFFRGDQYLRYDLTEDKVDDGYPLPLSEWHGLPEAG